MEEIWKKSDTLGDNYEISNLGRARSLDRYVESTSRWGSKYQKFYKGVILSTGKSNSGYLQTINNKYIHRLVAEAFIPNPEHKPEIHHINHNRLDNRVENLMWVTRLQNMRAGTQIQRRSKPVVLTNIKTGEKIYFKSGMEARRAGYNVDKVMSDKYVQNTTKGYTVEWDDPKKYL